MSRIEFQRFAKGVWNAKKQVRWLEEGQGDGEKLNQWQNAENNQDEVKDDEKKEKMKEEKQDEREKNIQKV